MKKTLFVLLMLSILALMAGCGKDEDNRIEHYDDFESSYQVWLSFKQNRANSYVYKVTGSS